MGWFSKAKKKLKKLKLKDVGKALSKGIEKSIDVAKLLPAPVGTIAGIADKGVDLVSKVTGKIDKVKSKLSSTEGIAEGINIGINANKSRRSSSSPSRTRSTYSGDARAIARQKRREERARIRLAKRTARADGYSKY